MQSCLVKIFYCPDCIWISSLSRQGIKTNWDVLSKSLFVFPAALSPENCRPAMRPVLSLVIPTNASKSTPRSKKKTSPTPRGRERRASRAGQPRLFPPRPASGPRSRLPVRGFCLKETKSTQLATPGRTWCPSRGLSLSLSCNLRTFDSFQFDLN